MRFSFRTLAVLVGLIASACAATGAGNDSGNGNNDGAQSGNDAQAGGQDSSPNPGSDSGAPGQDVQPPRDAGPPGTCVPTVALHHENTNALCSNGIDDDCNGYIDCDDYECSMYTPSVTVCNGSQNMDAGTGSDAGTPPRSDAAVQAGGTVNLLHFGVFGDVRPNDNNMPSEYPTATITNIMQNLQSLGSQFAIATGDYMFATDASSVTPEIASLLSAEANYGGYIFHGMGNHECTGAVASDCPNFNETPNVQQYLSRLTGPVNGKPYFDWVVHTSMGDAHFISTAPNAWGTAGSAQEAAQTAWLQSALAQPATYTFLMVHESPDAQGPPYGEGQIESILATHGAVTLRLYGHTHEYNHLTSVSYNAVVDGNAGAPLDGSGTYFGFAIVDQNTDGTITLTAYQTGNPPMVVESWSVNANGTRH